MPVHGKGWTTGRNRKRLLMNRSLCAKALNMSSQPLLTAEAERLAAVIVSCYKAQPALSELEITFRDPQGNVRVERALVITTEPDASETATRLTAAHLRVTDIVEIRGLRSDGIVVSHHVSGLLERHISEAIRRERGIGTHWRR